MACMAACLTSTTMAQTLTIDDFLTTPIASVVNLAPQSSTSYTLASPGALGGTRAVSFTNNYDLSVDSTLVFFTSTVTSNGSGRQIGGAIATPSPGSNPSDVDLEFVYFANGAGLGADLTPYPEIALLWEGDHHGFGNDSSVSLTLEDSLGNPHTETFSWAAGIPNDDMFVETLRWDLNKFDNEGVDLSDVDKITLSINTDHSADYAFSSLALVPEPSTSAMAALSFGVFLTRRKRSNRPQR